MSGSHKARRVRRALLPLLIAAPLAAVVAGQLGGFNGQPPQDLGVAEGRLKPPSATRNSVSSQADLYPDHPKSAYANIDPFPLRHGTPDAAMQALLSALASQPGVRVIQQRPDYAYAQARTRWLGFVDDLEFWVNPAAGVIEVRSASRLGREDFGTNRERVESIRATYLSR